MTWVIISKVQVLTLNEMKRDQWVWVLVEDFSLVFIRLGKKVD